MSFISVCKHDCGIGMLVSLLGKQAPKKCPFYWFWKYGDSHYGGFHYFTAFGYRIVIKLAIPKPNTTTPFGKGK